MQPYTPLHYIILLVIFLSRIVFHMRVLLAYHLVIIIIHLPKVRIKLILYQSLHLLVFIHAKNLIPCFLAF